MLMSKPASKNNSTVDDYRRSARNKTTRGRAKTEARVVIVKTHKVYVYVCQQALLVHWKIGRE